MNNRNDYETFWKEREKALGSPVIFRTMVRIDSEVQNQQWALFYGTSSHCYLQFFENRKWFMPFLNTHMSGQNSCCEIDYTSIESMEFIPEKTFLRIFTVLEGMIKITFREETEINSLLSCKCCILFPMSPVRELEKTIPFSE